MVDLSFGQSTSNRMFSALWIQAEQMIEERHNYRSYRYNDGRHLFQLYETSCLKLGNAQFVQQSPNIICRNWNSEIYRKQGKRWPFPHFNQIRNCCRRHHHFHFMRNISLSWFVVSFFSLSAGFLLHFFFRWMKQIYQKSPWHEIYMKIQHGYENRWKSSPL